MDENLNETDPMDMTMDMGGSMSNMSEETMQIQTSSSSPVAQADGEGFRQYDELIAALSTPDKKERKSVLDLTQDEKNAYTSAVVRLSNTPVAGTDISVLDFFVMLHVEIMAFARMPRMEGMDMGEGPLAEAGINAAHFAPAFASWHRELLARYEKALQQVSGNPNLTVPYWDFTDPRTLDVLFSPNFLGGNGAGENITYTPTPDQNLFPNLPATVTLVGGPLKDGPFTKANGYSLDPRIHTSLEDSASRGDEVRRYLYNEPWGKNIIPKEDVEGLMALDDPSLFISALEGDIRARVVGDGSIKIDYPYTNGDSFRFFTHNYIHDFIGGTGLTADPGYIVEGTMNLSSSPYDPVFWMLHANIDRLWTEWQADGHNGPDFHSTYNPITPGTPLPYGQNLDDLFWPWDNRENTPRYILAETDKNGNPLERLDINGILNSVYGNEVVRLRDPIDLSSGRFDYTYTSVATRVNPANSITAEMLLNPVYYLKSNADLAAAVNSGTLSSTLAHFSQKGYAEGRNPSAIFDKYVADNPDVAAGIAKGQYKSGFDHFIKRGMIEGRGLARQMAGLDSLYKFLNPDVAQAVKAGLLSSGIEHLFRFGLAENRNPFPIYNAIAENFDYAYYEAKNTDVATAVVQGKFSSSLQHFIESGMFEGRDPSRLFSNKAYGVNNPDVANAVGQGAFDSAFEHFLLFGESEGRPTSAGTAVSYKKGGTKTGTAGDDVLLGSFGNDMLVGGAGDDLLDGCDGNDTLTGGAGMDRFLLSSGMGMKTISDFTVGQDTLQLPTGITFGNLSLYLVTGSSAQNTMITNTTTGEMLATLNGVAPTSITASSFVTV
ncbi:MULTISPECIES: tyrosinase family protein [Oscillatoriales]|nr:MULTISPECIES: tyrosinase family protein [Oscillatoriales]